MANSLFEQYGRNQNGSQLNQFGGQQNIMNTAVNIANDLRNRNLNPQTVAQQLLQSGRMTNEQFARFSSIANLLAWKRR